jgi:hypothetical protein
MADLSLTTSGIFDVVRPIESGFPMPAGAALTLGQVVTIDPTNGTWVLADANVDTKTRPLFIVGKSQVSGLSATAFRHGVFDGFDLTALSYGDRVYLSATPGAISSTPINVNQVQTVAITGTLTGGHFHLTFAGSTTGNIAHNASAADIQAALELLVNIGSGNVVVAGTVASFTITFRGELAGDNALVTVDTSALTTSDAVSSSVTDTTPGAANTVLGFVMPGQCVVIGTSPNKVLYFKPQTI